MASSFSCVGCKKMAECRKSIDVNRINKSEIKITRDGLAKGLYFINVKLDSGEELIRKLMFK